MRAEGQRILVKSDKVKRIADAIPVVGTETGSHQSGNGFVITIVQPSPESVVEGCSNASLEGVIVLVIVFALSVIAAR